MSRTRTLLYFFAIGIAFLFIEIAFIQRFIQFLHHPLYAVSVVLTAFLLFAGLGSLWTSRLRTGRRGVALAVGGIVLLGLLYLQVLGPVFSELVFLPITWRVPVSILLIAPLAFCMGMPFPLGMARLAAAEGIERIEASRWLRPAMDQAIPAGRVDEAVPGGA